MSNTNFDETLMDCEYEEVQDTELTEEQEQIWNEMIECSFDVANTLLCSGCKSDELSIRIAAYLLMKSFAEDSSVIDSIETVFNVIDDDIAEAALTLGLEKAWKSLLALTEKYASSHFALVSILRSSAESYTTPYGVLAVAEKLLNLQEGERIADLCSGLGTMADCLTIPEECAVDSYEINAMNVAIQKISAEMSACDFKRNIVRGDVFSLLGNGNEKYDKIFSHYPWAMFRRGQDDTESPEKVFWQRMRDQIPALSRGTSSDWLFNMLMVDNLADDGKAVAIMTNGSTWNTMDTPVRSYFVENGLIETVISLPEKLFLMANIPTTIIVFSHGNKGVRLVDATRIYSPGRRINELREEDVDRIFQAVCEDGENSVFVTSDELRQNDYVINPGRYFNVVKKIENGVSFDSVIKRITRGAPLKADELDQMTSHIPTNTRYLTLANIQNGLIDENLPYLSEIDSKLEKYCLKNRCLILSKNGKPYKVAVAEVDDHTSIVANGNLYIIELDEERINPYFLAAFLESEQGTALLSSITVGTAIPNLGVEQLKKIVIPAPSLEEQEKIAKEYCIVRDEIKLCLYKTEKAKQKLKQVYTGKEDG